MKAIGGTDHVPINMVAQDTKVDWYTAKKFVLCHEAGLGYEVCIWVSFVSQKLAIG